MGFNPVRKLPIIQILRLIRGVSVMAIAPQASKLDAALQEAVRQHQAGRVSEAEKLYRRILRERPSHPGANNALGIALKDQGKLDEAAAVFRRAASTAPDFAAAHSNLRNILF